MVKRTDVSMGARMAARDTAAQIRRGSEREQVPCGRGRIRRKIRAGVQARESAEAEGELGCGRGLGHRDADMLKLWMLQGAIYGCCWWLVRWLQTRHSHSHSHRRRRSHRHSHHYSHSNRTTGGSGSGTNGVGGSHTRTRHSN